MIGYCEAMYFYYRINSRNNALLNEHPIFTVERFLMWIPFEIGMATGGWLTYLNGLCLIPMFIMIHDGIYYWKRNKLDKSYPLGFWDMTTSSTSWMDRNNLTTPGLRLVYFIIGCFGLIIINYVYAN